MPDRSKVHYSLHEYMPRCQLNIDDLIGLILLSSSFVASFLFSCTFFSDFRGGDARDGGSGRLFWRNIDGGWCGRFFRKVSETSPSSDGGDRHGDDCFPLMGMIFDVEGFVVVGGCCFE